MSRFQGGGHGSRPRQPLSTPLFDPGKSDAELFDTLAEQQAHNLEPINSSQLRRFFTEIKDLYRRFDSLVSAQPENEERTYREQIEPLFKMVRSKVSYATRASGQGKMTADFADMLDKGIQKVSTPRDFRRFVMHLEAVVGFMYGKGRVN